MIKNTFIIGLSIALVVTCYKLDKVEKAYLEQQEQQVNSWIDEERVITLDEVPDLEFEEEEGLMLSGDPTLTC